jgi:DOPA 4,5-dioxygenase
MTVSAIADWHAHVYYDDASKPRAQTLRRALEEAFPQAGYGRWHDRPVGPHPHWSYQVAFPAALFAAIVPWLALNRDGLTVFIHPNTADDLSDHRDHALWMGSMPALDLSQFE